MVFALVFTARKYSEFRWRRYLQRDLNTCRFCIFLDRTRTSTELKGWMILPAESSLYLKGLPAHFTKIVHSWQRQRQQERQCYRSCLPVISIRSDLFDTSTVMLIRTVSRLGKQRPLLHFLYVRKCNVSVWINSLISLLDVDSSAVASNAKIWVTEPYAEYMMVWPKRYMPVFNGYLPFLIN